MAVKQPWFVTERAEALAIVQLTRRPDLEIIPTPRQRYDLLVRIGASCPPAKPRLFAVETRGMERRSWRGSARKGPVFAVEYAPEQLVGEGLPVCTFLYMVDEEDGYYRWLHEPVLTSDGQAELRLDQGIPRLHDSLEALQRTLDTRVSLAFTPLDDEAITAIVNKVTKWYEARDTAHGYGG